VSHHHDARRRSRRWPVEPPLVAKLMPRRSCRGATTLRFRPWWEKTGITLGMGMTEKQGGTDVRANRTRARSPRAKATAVNGDKWFMSAPMCDAFLVLAQAPGGLTCVLMPRFRPDGSVNGLHFQRLKDKLGNRSKASSEVEFAGRLCLARGRGGQGRAHHHQHGAAHAARLRHRVRRHHAHGARPGAASCAPPHGVPEASGAISR
jgi:alkylation response protein AidB-like acyl-CoA dehydrogenase